MFNRRYQSEQERNLTILTRAAMWVVIPLVAFGCWWLYQGLGYFKDEMSYQDVYGARRGPHLPLPEGVVSDQGFGFSPRQLLAAGQVPPQLPQPNLHYGARLYRDNCQFCHAASGRGDAPVGLEYDPAPPLLYRVIPGLNNATVFDRISNGTGMDQVKSINTYPPIGDAWHAFRLYLGPNARWQLTYFLRAEFGSGRPPNTPPATAIPQPAYHIVGNPPAATASDKH